VHVWFEECAGHAGGREVVGKADVSPWLTRVAAVLPPIDLCRPLSPLSPSPAFPITSFMNQSIDSFRCKGRVERSQKKQVGRPAYAAAKVAAKQPAYYMLRIECGKALTLDVPIRWPVPHFFSSYKFQRGTKGIYHTR
jgi:hypothetical protein